MKSLLGLFGGGIENLYQVRAYNVRHSYNVSGFLEDYRKLLQKAIDEIWVGIRWVEMEKRVIPAIPKTSSTTV